MNRKVWWTIALVAVIAVAGWQIRSMGKNGKGPKYRLAKIERGEVTATVSATGTLSAVTTVKVGSQVSGIVSRLHADYNSTVRKGQLLAELDPTNFQAQVDQRKADVEKSKIELRNSSIGFERQKKLLAEQLASQSEFDAAEAAWRSAAASLEQSEAALRQAQANLAYTRIVSPIDGVVVSRDYDVGQTVAASFQAPTLFTIAQDLTKMQVAINVDEADVGRIHDGQLARFTVDAFPDAAFDGRISQIRLAPQTVQNVVTYPVLLDVDNPELKLKPGMTASVGVPVETRNDTLRVPNSALRFRPDPTEVEEEKKKDEAKGEGDGPRSGSAAGAAPPAGGAAASSSTAAARPGGPGGRRRGPDGAGGFGPGAPGGGRGGGRGGDGRRGDSRGGTIYVVAETGKLRAVPVRTGITDGSFTAIESMSLKEGDEIVVGLATSKAMEGTGGLTGGPMGGGRRGSGGGAR